MAGSAATCPDAHDDSAPGQTECVRCRRSAQSARRRPLDTACPAQPAGLRTRGHRPRRVDPGSSTSRAGTTTPSLPRPCGPVLCDGGRSRSPLRDSPGFSPGSLSPSARHRARSFDVPRTPQRHGTNQLRNQDRPAPLPRLPGSSPKPSRRSGRAPRRRTAGGMPFDAADHRNCRDRQLGDRLNGVRAATRSARMPSPPQLNSVGHIERVTVALHHRRECYRGGASATARLRPGGSQEGIRWKSGTAPQR